MGDYRGISPMPMTGNIAENWKMWRQRFENYLVASEIKKKDETTQIAQLLHYIGVEGYVIYNTFSFDTAEENKLSCVLKKFEDHFLPKKNLSFERFKFFTRKQLLGESIEQFVTDLKNKASTCEFDHLKNCLVKDVFTCGLQDVALRQKLLQDDSLTLDDAVRMCVSVEKSRKHSTQMNLSSNLVPVVAVHKGFQFPKPFDGASSFSRGDSNFRRPGGPGSKYVLDQHKQQKGKEKMHGVKRVMLFFVMTAVLPAVLIVTPLYLRHYIFADVTFPVAESDVIAIREGYSSIFCDALKLTMNSSFNAFQLVGTPKISKKRRHIRLKKSMILPDDTLEYWGFYLLKGATVRLKVCSRHEGARILVVRGGKNLNTCGLMDHNYVAYGAKMDAEYKEVKVFDEEPADYLGELDFNSQINNAREDLTNDEANDDLILKDPEQKETNSQTPNGVDEQMTSNSKVRHQKRHTKRWRTKVDELKRSLEVTESRPKRSISPLDAHIKHGGNAMNFTDDINLESDSVSSFETDLLRCYDSKILLSRGFVPSRLCNTMEYLDKSNHMVTEHTVVSDGYYYYIFYSDNDFVKNDIHAVFNIYKPTYGFANTSSGHECINQTKCEFPIHLVSDETVIVEVPTRDGIEHEDDDITLLTSTCKPRMGVYMIFPILVLLSILICAFL